MTSLNNATTDDSKSKKEYLGAGFFSRIAGELLQLPDAIKTTRIATKIVNGFKRDAVSTRAREEIGTLVAKCLRLGCSNSFSNALLTIKKTAMAHFSMILTNNFPKISLFS